jgi:hypothetical protein
VPGAREARRTLLVNSTLRDLGAAPAKTSPPVLPPRRSWPAVGGEAEAVPDSETVTTVPNIERGRHLTAPSCVPIASGDLPRAAAPYEVPTTQEASSRYAKRGCVAGGLARVSLAARQ